MLKAIVVKKISKNNVVVKSNDLVSAIYNYSAPLQRIILMAISMVNSKEDKQFQNYKIPISLFNEIAGLSRHGYYKELNTLTDEMMRLFVKLEVPDEMGFVKLSWFSRCVYNKREGYIETKLSDDMKPYLLNLVGRFTQYKLKNILPLRSSFSIRLYELLKQYEIISERYFTILELKKLLEIQEPKYQQYSDFKKYVILVAQKELPRKTDISFEFKEKKAGFGKKIEGIYFFIKSNKPDMESPIEMVMHDNEAVPKAEAIASITNIALYQRLQEFGFSPDQAKALMLKYKDDNRLNANLDYAEIKIRKGGVEDVAAYTATIIQNDAKLQMSLFDKEKEEAKQKKQQREDAAIKEDEEVKRAAIERKTILEIIEKLPKEDQEKLMVEADKKIPEIIKKSGMGYKLTLDFEMCKIYREWYGFKQN